MLRRFASCLGILRLVQNLTHGEQPIAPLRLGQAPRAGSHHARDFELVFLWTLLLRAAPTLWLGDEALPRLFA